MFLVHIVDRTSLIYTFNLASESTCELINLITWIRRLRIWLNNCSTWTVQYGSQDWYKGYKGIHFRDSPIPTPSQHWEGSNKMAPIVKCVLLCSLFVTGRWKKCNIQFQFMTYLCMQLNIYCLRSAPHLIYCVK